MTVYVYIYILIINYKSNIDKFMVKNQLYILLFYIVMYVCCFLTILHPDCTGSMEIINNDDDDEEEEEEEDRPK